MRKFAFAICMLSALSLSAAAQGGAETDCSTTDGWHGNNSDPGMMARVESAETGVIKITQDGADTWGKAAFVAQNIDLSKTPVLELKVNKVDKDAGYQVLLAPKDWSETITLVERNSADGVKKENLQKAINKNSKNPDAYAAPATFNIVVVVEGKGKSVWIDSLKIGAE